MKKILCLFGVLTLALASCSKDDDDNNSGNGTNAILVKTVTVTYPEYPSENSESGVTYNGNKLVSVSGKDSRTDYTYEGNLIVKQIDYEIEDGKDSKSYEVSYRYTNGKLAESIYSENFTSQYPFGQYKGRSVYTYNPDGTVKRDSYSTDYNTGIETKSPYIALLTLVNGNITKSVVTYTTPSSHYVYTSEYEYDTKNTPLKNVLGYSLLLGEDESSSNNIVKRTKFSVYGSEVLEPYVNKTTYEYNANGYPTKKIEYREDGVTVEAITEYTY
ncbi:hypothetical protein [Flavobacterium fluviale]|uniref:YD repeat-containing protein n=1 Tax=Flavobacterium fluviale TaxID=2249356 RepID=A0A344LS39_9FLAO|nr:hypothetical protein [Flavobacterium fluviale]AXB56731.1 hypothetical protein HYN86_09020 [Flavobacterium fluviale]